MLSTLEPTVVFMGINQDDVSYKMWAQEGAEVVIIPENAQNGALDLLYLQKQLGKRSPLFSTVCALLDGFQHCIQ